MQILY